jgi:hypothetical protein
MRNALSDALRHLSRAHHSVQPDHLIPVHVSGSHPQRILVVGAEAAAGLEARTDELTLPGHLARSYAILSGRGVDVDVIAGVGMAVDQAVGHLRDGRRELGRYSAIVLSLGAAEILSFMPERQWTDRLDGLLSFITERANGECRVLVLLPRVENWPPYVSPGVVDRMASRAARWSRAAESVVAGYERAAAFTLPPRTTADGTPWRIADYNRWGRAIAGWLYGMLPVATSPGREEPISDASLRRAVESLALDSAALGGHAGEAVSSILHSAKDWFAADAVALTLIDGEDVVVSKAIGLPEGIRTPREQTPCDSTVRRPAGHVVPHLDQHPQFARLAHQTGFRFYAGYRVEAPSGLPVGTLCLFRAEAEGSVNGEDMTMLRDFAWRLSVALAEGKAPGPAHSA